MNSSQPILAMSALKKVYRLPNGQDLTVLNGIDLEISKGQMVGLVGPSGSGKSSFLHLAGLLEAPTSGRIWIKGEEVTDLKEARRARLRQNHIGFVYQFHHLLPEFDALDNVALPMRMSGHTQKQARARAKDLLVSLGLEARLSHQPAQMSGGEQQRVAIARALSNRPELLLADEPTGNLDPKTSETVFFALQTLVRQEGVAVLIATHNLQLAAHMDLVLSLQEGQLQPRSRDFAISS